MIARNAWLLLAALVVASVPKYALASACTSGAQNPVVAENCASDSSTWSSAWKVDRGSYVYAPVIFGGYASASSVNVGGSINFYVQLQAKNPGYTMKVYRIGWYNGAGGRLVETISGLKTSPQPPCRWQNHGTATAYFTCNNWHVSYTLHVPTTWVSGVYVAQLVATAEAPPPTPSGVPYANHIVFVVRDDARNSQFLYQQAIATEQAYNSFSYGPSLYNTQAVSGNKVPYALASFERPFDALDSLQVYRFEFPFIYWLESNGFDVSYATDIDTHERAEPIAARHHAFLTAGHSEYWSKPMYDNVQAARDAGVHLGFFSGDTIYWQMRLQAEQATPGDGSHATADRVMAVYRYPYPPNSAGLGDPDPDQTLQTVYWRQMPLMRDEAALVGVHFTHPVNCREHVAAWATTGSPPTATKQQASPQLNADPQPMTVIAASHWVFGGSGAQNGDTVANVYGQEADVAEVGRGDPRCGVSRYDPPTRRPNSLFGTYQVLTQGTFNSKAILVGRPNPGIDTVVPVNSVIYQACSGAWVFAAGDIMWGNTLAPSLLLGKNYSSALNQQMSLNVLNVFAGVTRLPTSTKACIASLPDGVVPVIQSSVDD